MSTPLRGSLPGAVSWAPCSVVWDAMLISAVCGFIRHVSLSELRAWMWCRPLNGTAVVSCALLTGEASKIAGTLHFSPAVLFVLRTGNMVPVSISRPTLREAFRVCYLLLVQPFYSSRILLRTLPLFVAPPGQPGFFIDVTLPSSKHLAYSHFVHSWGKGVKLNLPPYTYMRLSLITTAITL
ncbi:hypothetical protein BKA93DRAFT_751155 [Sparassis latifolia]